MNNLRKAEIEAAYNEVIYGTHRTIARKNAAEKFNINVNSIGNGGDCHVALCDMSLRFTQTSAFLKSIDDGEFFEFLDKYWKKHSKDKDTNEE